MRSVTIDAEFEATLKGKGFVTLCDEDGNTIGYFSPAGSNEQSQPPISDADNEQERPE